MKINVCLWECVDYVEASSGSVDAVCVVVISTRGEELKQRSHIFMTSDLLPLRESISSF